MKPARGITVIIAVILIFVALVLGGAIFWYQKTSPKIPDASKELAKEQSPEASPTNNSSSEALAKDETANWKTYTSPCGFSLKYPEGYRIESAQKACGSGHHQDSSIISQDNGQTLMVNIYVDSSPKSTSFDEEISSYIGIAKTDQENTAVQGAPAVKFKPRSNEQAGFNGGISTGTLILKDNKFIQFSVTGDETTISIWDQILSTFKFLE